MASRLFSSRSKTLTLTFTRALNPSLSSSSQCLHGINSIGASPPPPADRRSAGSPFSSLFGSSKVFPCRPCQVPYGGHAKSAALCSFAVAEAHSRGMKHQADVAQPELSQSPTTEYNCKSESGSANKAKVISFSPLEGAAMGRRGGSALVQESLKIKRSELSQRITFALIPALLLLSSNSLATSLLILSVYWQIHGFFKEIFLDYVHHQVTQKWVLVYFQLLLLVLAKDTILYFNLV